MKQWAIDLAVCYVVTMRGNPANPSFQMICDDAIVAMEKVAEGKLRLDIPLALDVRPSVTNLTVNRSSRERVQRIPHTSSDNDQPMRQYNITDPNNQY